MLDEPDSSNRAITEDPSALYLNKPRRVMEMDGDIYLGTTAFIDGEPEDPIKLNSFVVKARLNVGARNFSSVCFMREAWRECGEGWHCYIFVKARAALDVDIGIRVIGRELNIGYGSIRHELFYLDILVEGEGCLSEG